MPSCPQCTIPLEPRQAEAGVTWACGRCLGCAVTARMLRRVARSDAVRALWDDDDFARRSTRPCPACRQAMREVVLPTRRGPLPIDVCRRCHMGWFDPGEYKALLAHVEARGLAAPVSDRAREALAQFTLQHEQFKRDHAPDASPDNIADWLIGFLGVPVVTRGPIGGRRPWATIALIAACSLVMLLVVSGSRSTWIDYAFVPADAWRHGGVTWLTSFFLHADMGHLLGNMLFLWVFGGPTERVLGVRRYLLLLAAATVLGDAIHAAFTSTPEVPCVGASGGISGVLGWYALAFPRARIALHFYYGHWFHLSARTWFAIWIVLQLLGPVMSSSPVAYAAHLGGALAGVAWYLLAQRARDRAAADDRFTR